MQKELVSFRIDGKLRETLEKRAEAENRSFSNLVETILLQDVKNFFNKSKNRGKREEV